MFSVVSTLTTSRFGISSTYFASAGKLDLPCLASFQSAKNSYRMFVSL